MDKNGQNWSFYVFKQIWKRLNEHSNEICVLKNWQNFVFWWGGKFYLNIMNIDLTDVFLHDFKLILNQMKEIKAYKLLGQFQIAVKIVT